MIGLLAVLLFQHQGYPLDTKKELEWEVRTTDTGSSLQLELIAENKSTTTVSLVFPTSKFFDFTIYDNGRVKIFTYSHGKYYLQAIQHITLRPGEKKLWKAEWNYTKNDGISGGHYVLRASLLPRQINGRAVRHPFIAVKEFEIHPKK